MKRLLASFTVAVVLSGVAFSQSLGDVARENRATPRKKAARVYTNEDIPEAKIAPSTAKPAAEPAADEKDKDAKAENADADKSSDKAQKEGDPDTQLKARMDMVAAGFEQAKNAVALLEREVDVLQREYKLQTVAFYSDAGSRLRDPKDWTEQRQKYEDAIASRQKALQDAKAKLEALRESARKAGVPASVTD
ncbi:MAG TPA: hypothetical protein VFM10_08605 [Terriglobales bacterium]|jgi:hypothetical protein|nr:hypothetical protein [Terriglobales bacterium]